MGVPQLLIPAGADELYRATIAGLVFVDEAPTPTTGKSILGICGNGAGVWVATYGQESTPEEDVALSTDDGATWAVVDTGFQIISQAVWDGAQFVCCIDSSFDVITSPDGTTWSAVTLPVPTFPTHIVLVGDRWVLGDASTPRRVHISDDIDLAGPWSTNVATFTPGSTQGLRESDDVDLIAILNSTNTNVQWYEVSSAAGSFTNATLVGAGAPGRFRFGPTGGDWFAVGTAAGSFWTSPDGKTWTRTDEATIAGWNLRDAYWDGTAWWVNSDDGGGNAALWEFDPTGPTWTQHVDLPDVGVPGSTIWGRPLVRRLTLDAGDLILAGAEIGGLEVGVMVMEGVDQYELPSGDMVFVGEELSAIGEIDVDYIPAFSFLGDSSTFTLPHPAAADDLLYLQVWTRQPYSPADVRVGGGALRPQRRYTAATGTFDWYGFVVALEEGDEIARLSGSGGNLDGVEVFAMMISNERNVPLWEPANASDSASSIPTTPVFTTLGSGLIVATLLSTDTGVGALTEPAGWSVVENQQGPAGMRYFTMYRSVAAPGPQVGESFSDEISDWMIVELPFVAVAHEIGAARGFTVTNGIRATAPGPTEPRTRVVPRATESLPIAPDPSPVVVPGEAYSSGRYHG